jgi:hypothetical protein
VEKKYNIGYRSQTCISFGSSLVQYAFSGTLPGNPVGGLIDDLYYLGFLHILLSSPFAGVGPTGETENSSSFPLLLSLRDIDLAILFFGIREVGGSLRFGRTRGLGQAVRCRRSAL